MYVAVLREGDSEIELLAGGTICVSLVVATLPQPEALLPGLALDVRDVLPSGEMPASAALPEVVSRWSPHVLKRGRFLLHGARRLIDPNPDSRDG
jgi:hypothetical protein